MSEEKQSHGGKREGAGRKATGLKRPERITFYVTAEEKERIATAAKIAGVSLSDYILSKLLP